MSNRMENYPNIEKLEMALNELAFHQVHQAWIDKKIPQYSLIILERWAELYPNTIKNLGMSELMTLALPQAQMELQILESKEAEEMREQGLTDMEILTLLLYDEVEVILCAFAISIKSFKFGSTSGSPSR